MDVLQTMMALTAAKTTKIMTERTTSDVGTPDVVVACLCNGDDGGGHNNGDGDGGGGEGENDETITV